MGCKITGSGMILDGSAGMYQNTNLSSDPTAKQWMVMRANTKYSGASWVVLHNGYNWIGLAGTTPSSSVSRNTLVWRVE